MFKILLAEDEKDIRKMMSEYLENNGFSVYQAENGQVALEILEGIQIDLLITDIMMPKIDGYSLTKDLRSAGYDLPVLMITAKETIDDKEYGYNSGTDDYMVKPIILKEMLLRVNALLKRAQIASSKKIRIGETVLDYDTFLISIKSENIEIPKKEFMLLFKLLSQPGRIFTRQQIMDDIWGYDTESDSHTVNVHVSRLRERFENCKDFEIVTVKGLGYKAVVV